MIEQVYVGSTVDEQRSAFGTILVSGDVEGCGIEVIGGIGMSSSHEEQLEASWLARIGAGMQRCAANIVSEVGVGTRRKQQMRTFVVAVKRGDMKGRGPTLYDVAVHTGGQQLFYNFLVVEKDVLE